MALTRNEIGKRFPAFAKKQYLTSHLLAAPVKKARKKSPVIE